MMTRRLWILSFAAGAWALFLVGAVASVFTYKLVLARPGPVVIERSSCPQSREVPLAPSAVIFKRAGQSTYEIDRTTLESILGNMGLLSRSARIVPEIRNGKAVGFRLYSVRPDGPFARLGFQNGDVISSINGLAVTSPEKALQVYATLKSASHLEVGLERAGQRTILMYVIR